MVAVIERARRKLRRDEYDRMVAAGLFQGERLELIRGELVAVMSPIGVPHATVVTELASLLAAWHDPGATDDAAADTDDA